MNKNPDFFDPKVGDTVYALYDGKFGRAKKAIVIKKNVRAQIITVEFVPCASEDKKKRQMEAERMDKLHFEGYLVGDGEIGIMRSLGVQGDFYSIVGTMPKEYLHHINSN